MLSLFSGIGGFDLAADRTGIRVIAHSENYAPSAKLLAQRWPEAKQLGDITKITEEEYRGLGAIDLVTAGWPCQDLSVAGNRAGLAGARSGLWSEVIRALAVLRPRWFVGENVPGLLSSKDGRDFGTVLGQLGELGYGWAYRVLDARYFGVAQRRRRVLIVGCLGDPASAAEVLLEPEGGEWHPAARRETREGAPVSVIKGAAIGRKPEAGPQWGETLEDGTTYTLNATEVHAVAGTLGGGAGERGWSPDTDRMTFVPEAAGVVTANQRKAGTGLVNETDLLVAQPLRANRWGGSDSHGDEGNAIVVIQDARGMDKAQNGLGVSDDGVAYTVDTTGSQAVQYRDWGDPCTTAGVHANQRGEARTSSLGRESQRATERQAVRGVLQQDSAVRRLTPVECERLQGFPDGWTDGFSDSVRYRMLGNAICVPVAEWVMNRLEVLSPSPREDE
jgi:DNA (cytosine-5)-methyltransferase 1